MATPLPPSLLSADRDRALVLIRTKMVAESVRFVRLRLKTCLAINLRHQAAEFLDAAGGAGALADGVAPCADAVVFRLDVELAVEVEAVAVAVQSRADQPPAAEQEIDAVGPRQKSAGDGAGGKAFRPLLLLPADAHAGTGGNGDADRDPLLDGHHLDPFDGRGRDTAAGEKRDSRPSMPAKII